LDCLVACSCGDINGRSVSAELVGEMSERMVCVV